MVKTLLGANAIVTGASRGIGTYIARTLAGRGVNVALVARNAGGLEQTRDACEALGVRAITVTADVTSHDDLRRVVETATRDLGSIDILVNNAGVEVTASAVAHTSEEIDHVIKTNLNAPIQLTRLVLPGMLERRRGAIVNIASMAGMGPSPYNSVYGASKHGLVGFTSALAMELDGTGVTAGVVCPGLVGEAGLWADSGHKAPAMMPEVSPQKCADAVLKCIGGAREALVMPAPTRPLLALAVLAPGLPRLVMKRSGILETLRQRAAQSDARADVPSPKGEPRH